MKNAANFLYHTLLLAVGSALCAIAINGILVPHEFLSGGLTGVALAVYYRQPIAPVGILYLMLNIPVFILGFVFVRPRFVFYTAWGMVIFSVMLILVTFNVGIEDKMLATIIAGGFTGIGVAVMMHSYGSAGGSEILCVIMNKHFSLSLGTGIIIINAVVLAISLFMFPIENIFYTLVYIVISALVTNAIFHGLAKRQAALIISDRWREIVDEMTKNPRIGVTLIQGKGGYHGADKTILYSVINRSSAPSLKRLVTDIDSAAFIAIMEAADVTGVEVGNQPRW